VAFPKHEQERVFDRLHQVKAGGAATEKGSGWVFTYCRELVQLPGNISVESEPGKGAPSPFFLPRVAQTDLLLVDDDPDMLE
jgi:signal transduction histidine kinase